MSKLRSALKIELKEDKKIKEILQFERARIMIDYIQIFLIVESIIVKSLS